MRKRYISLLDAKGHSAGILRLRWTADKTVMVSMPPRCPFAEESSLFFITSRGPVAANARPAPPFEAVQGAVVVKDGNCVLWGSCGFDRVDMEKEKVRVRLLQQGQAAKTPSISLPEPAAIPLPESLPEPEPLPQPEPEPDRTGSEPEPEPPEPELPPQQVVVQVKTAEERYRAVPEGAEEISGREEGFFMAEEIQGALKPGNSPALEEILHRAETIFSPSQQGNAFLPRPVEPAEPPRQPIDPRQARWEQGVAALLEAEQSPAQAPAPLEQPAQNPFPNAFPNTLWRRVYRPQGQGWYLEGTMRKGREEYRITAIPGEYRPVPPRHLQGFNRYIKAPDGGYWVRVVRQN